MCLKRRCECLTLWGRGGDNTSFVGPGEGMASSGPICGSVAVAVAATAATRVPTWFASLCQQLKCAGLQGLLRGLSHCTATMLK